MYSFFSILFGVFIMFLIGIMIFNLRKKITSLITWLQVFLCVSFFTGITLMLYYVHYYLGKSQLLQEIYFYLFHLSIFLFILIIGLRIWRYYKNKKSI